MKSEVISIRLRPELKDAIRLVFPDAVSAGLEMMFENHLHMLINGIESSISIAKESYEKYTNSPESPVIGVTNILEKELEYLQGEVDRYKYAMLIAFPDNFEQEGDNSGTKERD